jgi:predicted dehydrogenase
MRPRLRVGLVSAAHVHADAYADHLAAMANVDLVGIADPDVERGRMFAQIHGIPFLGDLDAMLRGGIDACVVTSENASHRADAVAAASAGVAVLCEKPLATNPLDAAAIVAAFRTAQVPLMTALPMRYASPVIEIVNAVRSGEIGDVRAVVGVNQGCSPHRLRPWFVDRIRAGGGSLIDHAVHVFDLARWITGREATEVWAAANSIFELGGSDVESGALVLVTLGSQTPVSIDCSWSLPAGYPAASTLRLEVVGDRGVLNVSGFRSQIKLYSEEPARTTLCYCGVDPNRAMLEAFVKAVRTQTEPLTTGTDGLRAAELVDAAYRSVASGQLAPVVRQL